MNTHNTHPLPTLPQLIKATGVALIVAAAILITTVLPAEHGIDPTGIGKTLGLTALNNSQGAVTKSNGNEVVAAAVAPPLPLPPNKPHLIGQIRGKSPCSQGKAWNSRHAWRRAQR